MKVPLVAFLVGLIFSIGLGISGMTQPQNIIGFLDIAHWNPALLFVMVGAVCIHALAYPFVRRRNSPLLSPDWHVPPKGEITPKLVIGSALFGIGWGLGGFCPGPALTSLASGDLRVFVFVSSMVLGMFLAIKLERQIK